MALSSEDRATATVNTHKKFGEVNFGLQTVGVAILDVWSLRYVSGQTDRHTNTLTAILRTPTSGDVITHGSFRLTRLLLFIVNGYLLINI